jgi:hypothetical protein
MKYQSSKLFNDFCIFSKGHSSSVSLETSLCGERLGFKFPVGARNKFFLIATMYRLALWSTKVLIQWFPGVVYLGVKGCEANH